MCRLPLLALLVVVFGADLASPTKTEGETSQLDGIEGKVDRIKNDVIFIKKKMHLLDRVEDLLETVNTTVIELPADIEKKIKTIEETVKKAITDATPKPTAAPPPPDNLIRDKDGYILAFRLTAGINQPAYDRYVQVGMNDDDNDLISKTVPCGCKSTDGSMACDRHYRSVVLDLWERLPITKVKVSVYKEGKLQKSIVFNGKGSTYQNFFQQSRIAESPYTDLGSTPTTKAAFFSIRGDERQHRRFFINGEYPGCKWDRGWLGVIDTVTPPCDWEKDSDKYPVVVFSKATKIAGWNSKDADKADVLTVSVLLEETGQCKA